MSAPFLNFITNPAYYNDFDEDSVAWLRELISRGLIAPGEVDPRSILEVTDSDLKGFTQCHFFAGIGGWSYALRLAGWPDDRPIWTGSPPCQPFSTAGRQEGRNDDRHLAPHFIHLVGAARPGMLFGEQVASAEIFGKVAKPSRRNAATPPQWAWLDDLSDRLEASRYTVGATDFASAGIGAPHIRQRTFFGAIASEWLEHASGDGWNERWAEPSGRRTACGRGDEWLADLHGDGRLEGWEGQPSGRGDGSLGDCAALWLGDGERAGLEGYGGDVHRGGEPRRVDPLAHGPVGAAGPTIRGSEGPGPTNGFWRDADWLFCRDDRFRPVEPGSFPLADGVSARVGRLRGYGNAINPWAASAFIQAFSKAAAHMRDSRDLSSSCLGLDGLIV
ncbi:DNA methylase [Rhodobacter phage RcCWillis]|nr:DNA methylase [Rhodobacter phage RcCWillis]